ncbi:MAG: hypothetical protein ACYTGX_00705 [Planctomycetota bacterium]|jgi:hypothetical protein
MARGLPIAIAFVLGLVTGALLLAPWLGRADPVVESAPLDAPATTPLPAPAAPAATVLAPAPSPQPAARTPLPPAAGEVAQPTPEPAAPPAIPAGTPAAVTRQSAAQLLGGRAFGTLEITVSDAEGSEVRVGDVYALTAGESQAADSGNFYQSGLWEGADFPVRLRVPAGHRLDVGYNGPGGHVLHTDITAPPGGTRRIALTLPPGERVTVKLPERPPETGAGPATITVTLSREEEAGEVDYPGRGQKAYHWGCRVVLKEGDTATSVPLPPGRYQTSVAVAYHRGRTGPPDAMRHRFTATPAAVTPGGTVTLAAHPQGLLRVQMAHTGTGGPKDHAVVIVVPTPNSGTQFRPLVSRPYTQLKKMKQDLVARTHLPPGTYRLEWGGQGAQRGQSKPFTLQAGGIESRTVTVVFGAATNLGDPRRPYHYAAERARAKARAVKRADEGEPIEEEDPDPFTVVIPPDPREMAQVEGASVMVHVAFRAAPGEDADGWFTEASPDDDELFFDPDELRRLVKVVATRGGNYASDPMEPRSPLEPVMRPGGLLILVPEIPVNAERDDADSPPLTIARADGAALPYQRDPSELRQKRLEDFRPSDTGTQAPLELGVVLGPFPEGPHTFLIRSGSVTLGTVETVVKAGTVRALPIR